MSKCPHCGSPEGYSDKYETRYTCGTVYPYDWDERRSKKCLELSALREKSRNI